jgi:hypothetical protein
MSELNEIDEVVLFSHNSCIATACKDLCPVKPSLDILCLVLRISAPELSVR